MRIIMCEDEIAQQQWMMNALKEWQENSGNIVSIQAYASAEELLFKKEEWAGADLMILDIELKEMNGMELAHEIRKNDEKISILFATGYEKFVFEGYEVGAISYIMKPVDKVKLFSALDKAAQQQKERSKTIVVGTQEDAKRVYLEDIYYIESEGHYCRIYLKDETVQVREKISELSKRMEEACFFLCHRSYLINVACISRITKKDVILDNGAVIPLARGKWEEVNRLFMQYYRR